MPKKRKPAETFDEHVGDVVENAMNSARLTQSDLAEVTGIPLTNMGRSIRGSRPLTVSEFERIASAVDKPSHTLIEEALASFGGIEKLMKETRRPTSDATDNVTPADNVTYIGHVKAPKGAAADNDPRTGPKD